MTTRPEPLTDQTREAQARAERLAARDRALNDLLELHVETSLWQLAGDISVRLRRFQGAGYPRIKAGYRKPRNTLETALTAILKAGGPCSRRRLYRVLQELPHTGTKTCV